MSYPRSSWRSAKINLMCVPYGVEMVINDYKWASLSLIYKSHKSFKFFLFTFSVYGPGLPPQHPTESPPHAAAQLAAWQLGSTRTDDYSTVLYPGTDLDLQYSTVL